MELSCALQSGRTRHTNQCRPIDIAAEGTGLSAAPDQHMFDQEDLKAIRFVDFNPFSFIPILFIKLDKNLKVQCADRERERREND